MFSSQWYSEMVQGLSTYKELPNHVWSSIENEFKIRTLNKNEYFMKQGQEIRELGFILTGGVRHYLIDDKENERTFDFCLPGEFTGSLEITEENPVYGDHWICAFEETSLCVISRQSLNRIFMDFPETGQLFQAVLLNYYKRKEQREQDLLSSNAAIRYQNFLKNFPGLSNRIPQYYIASYLGMTPETLSRTRAST